MYDLVIQNGTLVTPSGMFAADLAVKDGKICAVAAAIPADGAKTVDAAGKLVLPGAIDPHTHLAMPFGGTVSADDYFAGTRGAVCGGTTTIFDFALQDFGENMVDTIRRRDALCAPDACCDYAFHVGVKDVSGDLLDSMAEAVAYGVSSFKVFMVYDFGVTDGVFFQVLKKSREIGALIAVHAENNEMVNTLTAELIAAGQTDAWAHYLSRPEWVEAEADARAIALAEAADAELYIVHLANKQGLDALKRARAQGLPIYAETCPQYLHFTSDVYRRPDGRNFVCSPPMKGAESQKALWAGLKGGFIDCISTDHCPFQQSEKDWGLDDFRKIPNGCAGIENMYPYMLAAANTGILTFPQVVALCSANTAKLFGCTTKGGLEIGKDADIVIYDPEKDFTIRQDTMHSDADHTVWEGVTLHGYPVQTYVRGTLVYDNGEFIGQRGFGKYISRAPRPKRV